MGLFSRNMVAASVAYDVQASLAPLPSIDTSVGILSTQQTATRSEAMAVPTCSRAVGIISSSISGIPLIVRNKVDNTVIQDPPRVIAQPDPRIPGAATYVWLVSDLILYGYGYLRIMEIYSDTYRIRSAERIDPARVSIRTNRLGTEIEHYYIDGILVPDQGVGSLAVFSGNDCGILHRAGRTIRAGFELERAAVMYAREPVPTMVLKSNGVALPADRIAKLLDSWGAARRNRSTAFLNADVTLETLGFDPSRLQLNEARAYVAVELARAMNIPAYFVDADTGTSMTYSNATTARQTLLDFSLRPVMVQIEQRLSMSDFVNSAQEVKYNLDDYLRGSAKERADVYKVLFDMGALTSDEIRKAEDMIP